MSILIISKSIFLTPDSQHQTRLSAWYYSSSKHIDNWEKVNILLLSGLANLQLLWSTTGIYNIVIAIYLTKFRKHVFSEPPSGRWLFLNRVSEKSKSRLRLKRVYAFNLSRDLDFFRDEIQKNSTPVGGSENDGNFWIEWDTSVYLIV